MSQLNTTQISELLRRYATPFDKQPPAIISSFAKGEQNIFPFTLDSDRGIGILLLVAALYRPAGETVASDTVVHLYQTLKLDVFRLNRIPFPILRQALGDMPRFVDIEEKKRVPGILRSVGDFFYSTHGLLNWMATSDWETLTRSLSDSIFWMGKRSKLRTKARYFFWLSSYQSRFSKKYPVSQSFLWPISAGHNRWWSEFRSGTKFAASPELRLKRFFDLGNQVFPNAAWKLFQPLEAFLRPDMEHGFLCRKIQNGCRNCPLNKHCPAAAQFFLIEKPVA